jgi:hypothetical protein
VNGIPYISEDRIGYIQSVDEDCERKERERQ